MSLNKPKRKGDMLKAVDDQGNPSPSRQQPDAGDALKNLEQKMLKDVGLYNPRSAAARSTQKYKKSTGSPATPNTGSPAPNKASPAPDNTNLVASMARRLGDVEALCSKLTGENKQKQSRIEELENKCRVLEQSSNTESAATMSFLIKENKRLKAQIHEMETFLNDYNLTWVGFTDEEGEEAASGAGAGVGGSSGKQAEKDEMFFEMAKMKAAIADLNSLAGEGKVSMTSQSQCAFLCVVCPWA